MPANKLSRLSLKGRLGSNGGKVEVNDAAFELDEVKGTGGVTVTFSVPLSIVTRLEIDTIDVDSFLAKPAEGRKKAAATATAPATTTAKPSAPGPSLGLKLKINRAIYNKDTIGGIDVDLAMKGRMLELNDIKVSNLVGARLAVRGSIADYRSALPRADIAFNFEAPDMSRVLKVAGATAPTELGLVTASGGVSGTVEALTFRELRVAAQGQSAQIDGTLAMPGAARGPPSSIGYRGKVTASGQTIEGTVDARIAARPSITADLKTTLLDLDKMGGAAPAPPPARGARPAAAAPASSAIDTSAMRAFDASLKLSAGTLVSAPLRLSNADIAVTLKDGVLTLQHFKAGLYGGTLDLSGTVNGSKPALAFDLKGDASNIYLGEMLRSLSGTNQYGGAVKVTIDGRLSATGIALRGGGTTLEQVKASMAGGAQLGGHVFVGADKALTALGNRGSRRGRRRDRQHPGQRVGHHRDERRHRRQQPLERRLRGAQPLRKSRQSDFRSPRHRRRHADRQEPDRVGQPRHRQYRDAHQPRRLDHRHDGQLHDRRGWFGAVHHCHGPRALFEAEIQCRARQCERSARPGQHADHARSQRHSEHHSRIGRGGSSGGGGGQRPPINIPIPNIFGR